MTDAPKLEAIPAFLAFPEDLWLVGRDDNADKSHPLYDPRVHRAPKEARVISIMDVGVQAPVKVRKHENRLEVVDGRGRVIDAREANRRLVALGKERKKIRCIPESTTDDARLFGISIVCNSMRDDDDPDTEAEKIKRYIAEFKCSKEQAAETFGCSVQTIEQRLKLLQLSPKVRSCVRSRDLPVGQALKLLMYTFAEQDAALERMLRVRQETEARIRREERKAADGDVRASADEVREARARKGSSKKSVREINKIVAYLEANKKDRETEIVLETLSWVLGNRTDEAFGKLGILGKVLECIQMPVNKGKSKRQQIAEAMDEAAGGDE